MSTTQNDASPIANWNRQDRKLSGHMNLLRILIVLATVFAQFSMSRVCDAQIDFVRDVQPIFQQHCYECHGETKQKSGLRLDVKEAAFKGGDNYGIDIVSGKAMDSPLIELVTSNEDSEVMPPKDKPRLSAAEIDTLTRWINNGAKWPDGVDLVTLADKSDHWSFKPLSVTSVSFRSAKVRSFAERKETLRSTIIDEFIDAKLAENGLRRSATADPRSLIRRLSFDLIGLPPTPERVAAFVSEYQSSDSNETRQAAIETLVQELLDSPRYGERWAQHWLDVVRYADTHGFEVNTERPNAWPYRDYVIQAFNNDTPFDRFIQQQIVGDALGEDAATGFLVTASVLLPGQIGQDEPSKRLARQDSLDEIVNNIGQTFLGLSIGCARCHDHKFDPITSKDYYAMQAYVAGVEYADREMRTPAAEAARKEATEAQRLVAEIDEKLAQFVPLAIPEVTPRVTNAKENIETFEPLEAKFMLTESLPPRPSVIARQNTDRFKPVRAKRVRFTILSTNSLEPCVDELEVFNTAGKNVALASFGTQVTTSGDIIEADRHDPRFVNDGEYGNSRSWMSNQSGKGSVTLEFADEHEVNRVVWGRDREGKFEDRLATAYRIEVATGDDWQLVADSTDRSPATTGAKPSTEVSTIGLSPEDLKAADRLRDEKVTLEGQIKAAAQAHLAFAGTFRKPDVIHLLSRGDPEQPKEEVLPEILSIFSVAFRSAKERSFAERKAILVSEQDRRRELAEWIVSPQNPLTARVMVNRIWQGHFGTGLVETPSDFGRMGMKPTHPELLDWLADEFIRSGWSIKHMHRLIVLSATYQQRSDTSSQNEAALKDADVRLLWRYPSRRLEAETIRDSILAMNGRLNLKMSGRGFDLFDKRGGLSGFNPVESFQGDGLRRMVYAHKVRREREAVFGAFDCPDAGQSTARRRESTTPIQALNLFNSRFTLEQSQALADRVKQSCLSLRESSDNLAEQKATLEEIRLAYQFVLGRDPTTDELRDVEPIVREHGLATLGRALFNSNEALFLP